MVNDFDLPTIRKSLDALRRKHGADTPIGHRCSMIERLKIYPELTGDHKKRMEDEITKTVADLAGLTAKGN